MGLFNLPSALGVAIVSWLGAFVLLARRQESDIPHAKLILALSSLQFADVILWWEQGEDGLGLCSWLNTFTTGLLIPAIIGLVLLLVSRMAPATLPRQWYYFVYATIAANFIQFAGKCSDVVPLTSFGFFDSEEAMDGLGQGADDTLAALSWGSTMWNPVLAVATYIALVRPGSLQEDRTWYSMNSSVFVVIFVAALGLPYYAHLFWLIATLVSWRWVLSTIKVPTPANNGEVEWTGETTIIEPGTSRNRRSWSRARASTSRPGYRKRWVRRYRSGRQENIQIEVPIGSDPATWTPLVESAPSVGESILAEITAAASAPGDAVKNIVAEVKDAVMSKESVPLQTSQIQVGSYVCTFPSEAVARRLRARNRVLNRRNGQREVPNMFTALCTRLPAAAELTPELLAEEEAEMQIPSGEVAVDVPIDIGNETPAILEEVLDSHGDVEEIIVTTDNIIDGHVVDFVPAKDVAAPPIEELDKVATPVVVEETSNVVAVVNPATGETTLGIVQTATVAENGQVLETTVITSNRPGECSAPFTHVLNGSPAALRKFSRSHNNLSARRTVARHVGPISRTVLKLRQLSIPRLPAGAWARMKQRVRNWLPRRSHVPPPQ